MKIKAAFTFIFIFTVFTLAGGSLLAQNRIDAKKTAAEIRKDENVKAAQAELMKNEDFKKVYNELEQAKKQLDEAKKEIGEARKQLSDAGKLAGAIRRGDIDDLKKRLSGDKLLMGFFPNTDGFLDGKFDFNKSYLRYLNTSFNVTFSTVSDSTEEAEKFKSSSIQKDVTARAQLLGFQAPFQLSENGFLGLKLAAGSMYTYSKVSTSGYKVEQSSTVYFDTKKDVHNLSPSIDGEINMVLGRYFSLRVTGGYLPFVYIYEKGKKKYSTYEHPIDYSFRNVNQGFHVDGSLALTDIPIGDIELYGSLYDYGGDYQTEQMLMTGAYLTTIKTYSPYKTRLLDVGVNYTLTFLGGFSQYIPILSLGYATRYEKLGCSVLFNQGVYHAGLMIKVN